jgi:crotonobetainyl-CoA:carnitine CoA-transferase CaiB-like acyl-CoA transferase
MDQQRPSEAADMSRGPVGVGDHAASMSVVAGIGLALHHRHATGLGQLVDVSLLRAGVWANSHSIVAASASQQWARTLKEPMPLGGRPLLLQPYATASTQWIHLLGYETARHLPGVIVALGLGDSPLAKDPRFDMSNINVPANFTAAREIIAARMREKTAAEWSKIFDEHGIHIPTERAVSLLGRCKQLERLN